MQNPANTLHPIQSFIISFPQMPMLKDRWKMKIHNAEESVSFFTKETR